MKPIPLALLASCLLGGRADQVATAPPGRSEPPVVFSLGGWEEILKTSDSRTRVVLMLRLYNNSHTSVFVDPVIGQMCGTLELRSRPAGSRGDGEAFYSTSSGDCGCTVDDLFRLMPHRSLERRMEIWYPTARLSPSMEFWAEYDSRPLAECGPGAYGALMKSNAITIPVV